MRLGDTWAKSIDARTHAAGSPASGASPYNAKQVIANIARRVQLADSEGGEDVRIMSVPLQEHDSESNGLRALAKTFARSGTFLKKDDFRAGTLPYLVIEACTDIHGLRCFVAAEGTATNEVTYSLHACPPPRPAP